MRTLLIVRTHRADSETLAAFDRYSELRSAEVVVCCDERNAAVELGGRPKLRFDNNTLVRLGLFPHPSCGWRCGDYFYYVARENKPNYDFYWLVESDVFINTGELTDVFDKLNASTADFLAPHLGPRDRRWGWHRTVRQSYPEIYGCVFPITRLSARAIDHLHAARRSAVIPQTPAAMNSWPNDEAFVATELHNHDFECRELGHNVVDTYTRDTLRTGTPWDRAVLSNRPPDGRIYHPVRDFRTWFEEWSAWASDYALSRRGKALAHFRNDQVRLVRLASASLGVTELRQAALFPLMLASRMTLEASYEAETGQPDSYAERTVNPYRAIRTLSRWFGPGKNGRVFATAYLLSRAEPPESCEVAAQTDFIMDHAEPLHAPPVAFALPYAFNFDDESLFLTVHPLPQTILSANNVLHRQRHYACVGCKVPLRHLGRFYPIRLDTPRISFLLLRGLSVLSQAVWDLRASGRRVVAAPPALMQIARQRSRLFGLRRQWWSGLLWAALAPAFLTFGASNEPVVFVVSDEILAIRDILTDLLGDVTMADHVEEMP